MTKGLQANYRFDPLDPHHQIEVFIGCPVGYCDLASAVVQRQNETIHGLEVESDQDIEAVQSCFTRNLGSRKTTPAILGHRTYRTCVVEIRSSWFGRRRR
jgi:hypothetical protein